ncbi:Mut7-C RNAse domain-containing protein [Sphaerospermopsis torques-reginae]
MINEFHRCENCAQIYWKGSHYTRLQNFINEIMMNSHS